MAQKRITIKDSELQERINLLYHKFNSFKIYNDTLLTFEKFMDILNQIQDIKKPDKGVMLRIYNDIPKTGTQAFNLDQFFDSYLKNLKQLYEQNETIQKRLEELDIQKNDLKQALEDFRSENNNDKNEENNNKLYITVFEAKNLTMDSEEQIYVRINCGNVTVNTHLVTNSLLKSVVWHEKFAFPIKTGQEKINIVLLSKTSNSMTKILGNKQLPISSFKDQNLHEEWFDLAYDQLVLRNQLKLGIQWIYSKIGYLESTFERIESHLNIQEEEAKDLAQEIEKYNNLLPIQDASVFNFNTLPDNEISPKESPIHVLSILRPDYRTHFEEGFETLQNKVFLGDFKGERFSSVNQHLPYGFKDSQIESLRETSNRHEFKTPSSALKIFANVNQEQPFALSTPKIKQGSPITYSQNQKVLDSFCPTCRLCDCQRDMFKGDNINKSANFILEQKLGIVLAENSQLKKELDAIQKEKLKDKEKLIEQFRKDNEAQVFQLIGEVDRLAKTISEKNKEIEKWKNQYYTIVNQDSDLNKKLGINFKELEDENVGLNEKINAKNQEVINWKNKYDELVEKNLKISEELIQKEQEIKNMKKENSFKSKENNDLRLKIVQYEGIVKSLPTNIDETNYMGISEILQNSVNDSNLSKYTFQKNYFSPFAK